MRIEVPGGTGEHWVELRDIDALTAADDDAYQAVFTRAYARQIEDEANEEDEVSADGVSVAPKKTPRVLVTAEMLLQRRDDLLASLITDWSYAAPDAVPHIPLPYSADSRKVLPLPASKVLKTAIEPYQEALNAESGPKEPASPESLTDGTGSRNGSPDGSQNHLPDLTPGLPETASI
jgi:hypothetical protein